MFVVIDGPNGSGKTSIINRLKLKGIKTLSTPNATNLSKMLRPVCRAMNEWRDVNTLVQFLLFSACRVDEYIRCVKDSSDIIVADRWWTSTFVYQCVLEGFPVDFLQNTICNDEKIDLVILLDGQNDVLDFRSKNERIKNPNHGSCMWLSSVDYMQKIYSAYREELPSYLAEIKQPYLIIDTTNLNLDQVYDLVLNHILKLKGITCNNFNFLLK